jgi:hypothetical protein
MRDERGRPTLTDRGRAALRGLLPEGPGREPLAQLARLARRRAGTSKARMTAGFLDKSWGDKPKTWVPLALTYPPRLPSFCNFSNETILYVVLNFSSLFPVLSLMSS